MKIGKGVPQDDGQAVLVSQGGRAGLRHAQFSLAWMYQEGRGVPLDLARPRPGTARPPTRGMRSPNAIWAPSMSRAGACPKTIARPWPGIASRPSRDTPADRQPRLDVSRGTRRAQDLAQAAAWYRKAAEQGHARAQNNLGWLYENGSRRAAR